MLRCPNCQKTFENDNAFCDDCGTPLVPVESEISETDIVAQSDEGLVIPTKKKRRGLKIFGISAAVISLLLVAAIVVNIFYPSLFMRKLPYVLYLKDKELFYSKTTKIEPFQFTDNLIDSGKLETKDVLSFGNRLSDFTKISQDGKLLFYIDSVDTEKFLQYQCGAPLYYRYLNKPKKEPVKIDSNVSRYNISKDSDLVTFKTYSDSEDSALYQYNVKEDKKEKIKNNVTEYRVSEDGKTLVYLDIEGNLYTRTEGKEEKITSKVTHIEASSKDVKTVYFSKEKELYVNIDGKSHKKITDTFNGVYCASETGEIYYSKTEDTKPEEMVSYYYFVDDVVLESDNVMVKPVAPVANYQTVEQYNQYQKNLQEYNKKLEEYNNKLSRDNLRTSLFEKKVEYSSLCYYNGSKETVLSYTLRRSEERNESCLVYFQYNFDKGTKIKMSELYLLENPTEEVEKTMESAQETMLAVKGTVSAIACQDAKYFYFDKDLKNLYYLAEPDEEKRCGKLYQVAISGNKASTPSLYDSEVCDFATFGNHIAYTKNQDENDFDLYWDKTLVDSDARRIFGYDKDSDTLVYGIDYDEEDEICTLKIFKDKKTQKIADDVGDCQLYPNGDIVYLADYNADKRKGDLYVYNGGKKSKPIDTGVSFIIPITDPYAEDE